MPELPEVEVSRLGLLPFLPGQRIVNVIFRTAKLRHDLPAWLATRLIGLRVNAISRRGKYLLFEWESTTGGGWLSLNLSLIHISSLRPSTHNTSPRCAAISGSDRFA